MEDLFTFNSQQFQAIDRRPASTDNPPNIRKRIITSKMSKKSSIQSVASTKEDGIVNQNKLSPFRKVTFKLNYLDQNNGSNNQQIPSYLQKTASLALPESKENINQEITQKKAEILVQRMEKGSRLAQLGVRCLSTREKVDKQMISRNEEIINSKLGCIRQRRILSQKFSPKIVPISQRKLPKVFKINCVFEQSLPKIDRKDKIRQDLNDSNLCENHRQSYQIPSLQICQKNKLFRKQILFSQD